jgi:hypothetical protein
MSGAMRVRSVLLTAFLMYVALDLGCAAIPGAFAFDPAASVDAASSYRTKLSGPSAGTALPSVPAVHAPLDDAPPAPAVRVTAPRPTWRPHAGRDRGAARHPLRSPDDD